MFINENVIKTHEHVMFINKNVIKTHEHVMFINKNVIKTHEHVMFINKNIIKTNRVLANIPLHRYLAEVNGRIRLISLVPVLCVRGLYRIIHGLLR